MNNTKDVYKLSNRNLENRPKWGRLEEATTDTLAPQGKL